MKQIHKGWSDDKKYLIESEQGNQLLRVARLELAEQKRQEFNWMQKVAELGVPISRPLSFQVTNEVQSYFTWCEGRDAEEVLPLLTKEEQYELGKQSGVYLQKIHSLPAPDEDLLWEEKFSQKIDRKINVYQQCPLSFEGDEFVIRYIEENRHLLKGRPQSFQHGDYHTGNMILSPNRELSIIDFNRFDFGDPWEDFNRIVFTAELSPAFATGQLHGYFNGEPPELFFRLLALYIATNTLSGLPWAMNFGQAEIEVMREQAKQVQNWYQNMTKIVPTWYKA